MSEIDLSRLEDLHNTLRWHTCPDGYLWNIHQSDCATYWIGLLLGPSGYQLLRIEHHSWATVEMTVMRILNQHRTM